MSQRTLKLIEQFQQEWKCPISHLSMTDPVITSDGHSYDRQSIAQWLRRSNKSPKTGLTLNSLNLLNNIALKNIIQKFDNYLQHQIIKFEMEIRNFELQKREFTIKLNSQRQEKIMTQQLNKFLQIQNRDLKIKIQILQAKEEILQQACKQYEIKLFNSAQEIQCQKEKYKIKSIQSAAEIQRQKEKYEARLINCAEEIQYQKEKYETQLINSSEEIQRHKENIETYLSIIEDLMKKQNDMLSKQNVNQYQPIIQHKSTSLMDQSFQLIDTRENGSGSFDPDYFVIDLETQIKEPLLENYENILLNPKQKSLLPYTYYLVKNSVFYDFQKNELDNSQSSICMEDFLIHDWQQCKILNLRNCRIDDKMFEMFLREADKFKSLQKLYIGNNKIVNIQSFWFNNFRNLKAVDLRDKKVLFKNRNCLSEQSRRTLRQLGLNSDIKVYY